MRHFLDLLIAAIPAPLFARNVVCTDPQAPLEMTCCAGVAHEAADGDLNLACGVTMDQARRLDSDDRQQPSNAALMRAAQRKWIAFRDVVCSGKRTLARSGTMQNQLFLMCMERLMCARTKDLRLYGAVN